MTIAVYSCRKYYIDHGFRETYTNVNEVIHKDSTKMPFFKVHFKNGNVSLLDTWSLNNGKDTITGNGTLYDFNRNTLHTGELHLTINDIAIIETNEYSKILTKDNDKIAALSILTGANAILNVVCITNPKACFGSCPTFYVDGQTLLHNAQAEGFSSSISPSLERQDLDALQYATSSDEFLLIMKNEAFETHMINELYIQAVPKNKNDHVFQDKHGSFYQCGNLLNASLATVNNTNIASRINTIDEAEYFSLTDPNKLETKEEIILEYQGLSTNNYGLVINFRQTLLTTFLLYNGISYMGDEVGDYFSKIETNEFIKQKLSNPFKRLGKIKLSVWNEELKIWQFIEELYETGPIAKNLVIAPLNNINQTNNKIKIKIEMTKGLWRIDLLALTTIKSETEPYTIYPNTLDIVNGNAYTISDIAKDDHYYLISFPGNEFRFKFKLPELNNKDEFELFLSSKGYYLEWIRKSWLKDKNLSKLKKMLLNDDKTWNELAQEFKAMEDGMESVFWNSKFTNIQ
ncbi:hypothetical protein GCM10023314_18250 [Algibacter agarivorans]|uniref:Uncharacterized protein n=1 Tax=Algibacter agarivorans TaxID=1109741 RepID=A0ABP9GJ85_9FLAO